ncbi:hypothetical protein F4781DRAFT_201995 [Annulohypoxylon bovei var. microspora]|nr:hypothetical protein F4781DRAFT_201995 [Annulohypoxylon bovei var. microspora]
MVHMKKHEWMSGPTFSVDDVIDPSLSGGDSPSSSTTAPKRKRASRPKVRTGCITCKIRRVKCDETKPACTRCTSTGRKCDGYGGAAPPRPKKSPTAPSSSQLADPLAPNNFPSDPYLAKRHELARHSFAAACRGSTSLRILRPLAADIEGTEQERLFFHQFRRAAEAGLAMHASSLGAGFWRRLVPLVGQSDPAVRHALIALGAAHQGAQLQQEQAQQMATTIENPAAGTSSRSGSPDVMQQQQHQQQQPSYISTPPPEDSSGYIDQLEMFMIQQYNLSIYHLQQHVQPGSPPESVEITLICCLVFVCIETSRGNEVAALAHVANGLQIIKALPPDSELVHSSPGSSADKTRNSGASPRISRSDWRQLLDFFLALEPSAATYGFTSSQPPTPPCPTISMWETPLECFNEMLPQWEMEAAEVDI